MNQGEQSAEVALQGVHETFYGLDLCCLLYLFIYFLSLAGTYLPCQGLGCNCCLVFTIFLIFPNQKLPTVLLPGQCTSGALLPIHPEEAASRGERSTAIVLPLPSWGFPSTGGVCGALTQAGINLGSKLPLHLPICSGALWLDSTFLGSMLTDLVHHLPLFWSAQVLGTVRLFPQLMLEAP